MRNLGPYQRLPDDRLFRGNLISGLVPALGDGAGGGDQSHDITISAGGVAQNAGTEVYRLTSAITKRIDASWAEGTNQGGLDGTESSAGTPDASTWYHLWLIRNTSSTAVDVLFSESLTSPTLPAGWGWERRIGSVLTDGSANITAFFAREMDGGGIEYVWDVPASDEDQVNPGTSAVSVTLSAPPTIAFARITAGMITNAACLMIVTALDQTDTAPGSTNATVRGTGTTDVAHVEIGRWVNSSSQVRYRLSASSASITAQLRTIGWLDARVD